MHTPVKYIFLSTTHASQDVDALCDMIYTQLSRNASKNWKTTVVCLNALFHLIQPTSHYEPRGASFLRPPRCQQLEETFAPMPPGLLWKQSLTWHPPPSATAAAQISKRATWSCHKPEKAHAFGEKSCPLSPSHHIQHPHLFFPLSVADTASLEPMKCTGEILAPRGCSPCASATAQVGQCRFGLNQMPRERWVSLPTPLCCDRARRPLAVRTGYTTKFRLDHWYDLDDYGHQCP